jgi:hypothetical protein
MRGEKMKKPIYLFMRFHSLLYLIFLLFYCKRAYAYIDPGTTSVAFSALGYIFSMALLGITFFIRPLRNLIKSMFNKLTGKGERVGNKENQNGEESP